MRNQFLFCPLLIGLALAAGCGRPNMPVPEASDPSQARQALASALDAWKSGASVESLKSGSPQVFVVDEEWSGGGKLASYQIQGEGTPFGNNVRFNVALEVQPPGGGSSRTTAMYVVATQPVVSISRSDVAE